MSDDEEEDDDDDNKNKKEKMSKKPATNVEQQCKTEVTTTTTTTVIDEANVLPVVDLIKNDVNGEDNENQTSEAVNSSSCCNKGQGDEIRLDEK